MSKRPEEIGIELAKLVKGDVHVDVFNRVAFSTDASICTRIKPAGGRQRTEMEANQAPAGLGNPRKNPLGVDFFDFP